MTMANWTTIRSFFEEDDGGFPELLVAPLEPEAVCRAYSLVRAKIRFLIGNPCFYDALERRDKPITAVENPSVMVVQGTAEPFHFLGNGITIGGTVLPDLGFFILKRGVAVDFQPGKAWGEKEVIGLFELLHELCALDKKAVLSLEEIIDPEKGEKIVETFHFLAKNDKT